MGREVFIDEVLQAKHGQLHSEVLHRVLYPNMHGNGFRKKKCRDGDDSYGTVFSVQWRD